MAEFIQARRSPTIPEQAGRTLEAAAAEGQRVVQLTDWLLLALSRVREILGLVVARNEPVVADPTDAILGPDPRRHVRIPEL